MNINLQSFTCRKQLLAAAGLAFVSLVGMLFTSDIDKTYGRRQLQIEEETTPSTTTTTANFNDERKLAVEVFDNPPAPIEIADSSYIIKPVVGYGIVNNYEQYPANLLNSITVASASNPPHYSISEGQPYNVLDISETTETTYWKSVVIQPGVPQYLEFDLGIPQHMHRFQMQFSQAGNVNFELQGSMDGYDWTTYHSETGFTSQMVQIVGQGSDIPNEYMPRYAIARYLRVYFTGGQTAYGEAAIPSNPSTIRYYQVENQVLSGVARKTAKPGYTGSGYGDYGEAGTYVEFRNIDAGQSEGTCSFTFRYANGDTVDRTCEVAINGVVKGNIAFAPTGDWYRWGNSVPFETDCPSGSFTLRITAIEAGPNLDRLMATRTNLSGPIGPYYSVDWVKIARKRRIISSTSTQNEEYCGGTADAVKTKLLGRYGGSLIQLYPNSEYFSASLTEAQATAMADDSCAFAVEPNYVIKARGRATKRLGASHIQEVAIEEAHMTQDPQADETHRRLGIPEFNMLDESPGNWGLERISTRGRRNGKYIWVSEGFGTDVYVFDTGIYSSQDFIGRDADFNVTGASRLQEPYVCAGLPGDEVPHGTFVASLAIGKKYGVGKSAALHSIQILDENGEGSIASLLCGMEKLIQDGIEYYAANAPNKIKAVVNLSVGANGYSAVLNKAAEDLVALGYTVVIAAGDNDGGNACHYSPSTPSAIRVGALKDRGLMTDGTNDKTDTSNYGECIDIWAPGENIVGATNEDYETITLSGTSVAAAFVSGAATMFLGEILSSDNPQSVFGTRTKEKMLIRAERDVLGDIGVYSSNRMLQTTSSACEINAHCDAGKVCMYDGACGNINDYFR